MVDTKYSGRAPKRDFNALGDLETAHHVLEILSRLRRLRLAPSERVKQGLDKLGLPDAETAESAFLWLRDFILTAIAYEVRSIDKQIQLAEVRPRSKSKFTEAHKRRVVMRARTENNKKLAAEIGIAPRTLANWKKTFSMQR
jgi:hypothetical protein